MSQKHSSITVVWIADGYLWGAADTADVWGDGYWGPRIEGCVQDEEGFTTRRCRVPVELAERLKKQGTGEQFYADGYEAANALATYYAERRAARGTKAP